MKARLSLIPILIAFFLSSFVSGQEKRGLLEKKRTDAAISNYYITLNLEDGLLRITGLIEWQIDSLVAIEQNARVRNNLMHLKYDLISVLTRSTFNSDPLMAALDTWALDYQLVNYLASKACDELYNNHNRVIRTTMLQDLASFEKGLGPYISGASKQELKNFADENPIYNERLHRKTVVGAISAWVSEDELRLKSGLLTMTDLMRDMSFRLNYFSEMLPKQARWQVESSLSEFTPKDSLLLLLKSTNRLMMSSAQLVERADELIAFNRDTLLSAIDYERIAAMRALKQERVEVLKAMSSQRELVMNGLQEERKALELFATSERIATLSEIKKISREMMTDTIPLGKTLIDYVFVRSLMLIGLLGFFILAGMVIWKRKEKIS